MLYALSFFFGAAIGSFVQLVAARYRVAPIVKSRSKCLSCGEALRALDLIPIFSYLFLKGKCRYCNSSYGFSTILIELTYGIIFVLLYHFILAGQASLLVASLWLIYYSLLFTTMGIIAIYDNAHTYIPVPYLLFYCFLTLVVLLIRFLDDGSVLLLLAPIIVALPFLLIWVITRGRGLGFGDVMLFLGVGAFFGIEQGFAVLLLSVWIGAIVGVIIYFLRLKNANRNSVIPFVPFIVIAFIVVLFTDIDLFSIARVFA